MEQTTLQVQLHELRGCLFFKIWQVYFKTMTDDAVKVWARYFDEKEARNSAALVETFDNVKIAWVDDKMVWV